MTAANTISVIWTGENMDISRFINSTDIRNYHKKIGYEYNSVEAAWLVSQCHSKTLEEKHEAWQWIIDNMTDMEIVNCGRWVSEKGQTIHKVLADYMEMEKTFVKEFKDSSRGWLYMYKYYFMDSIDTEGCFSSYENCEKHIMENYHPEETNHIEIRRGLPDKGDIFHGSFITIDLSGRILSVFTDYWKEENHRWNGISRFFGELWFNFPVPFKRGDIVYLKSRYQSDKHSPIVLDSIIVPSGEDKEEYIKKRREHGDTSDMDIWGYAADVEWCNGYNGIYNDTWWNYMDAEYYREELTGFNRLLKPVSNWLKGEFGDGVDLLLAGYHHIMMEEYLSRAVPVIYTKEGLKMAGFPAEGDE